MVVWPVDLRMMGAQKWYKELEGCEQNGAYTFFYNPHNTPRSYVLSPHFLK